ncbi:NAD(P)H-dependent oxidoreductase [Pseudooceanicola sp. CBS1P-1]|uniref:NADPH-dependent FMN reductase n=1 Tax=Pseudooceanicola albus TaxID=2692189 RepID=A0A6L7G950_9RHOB|nr:MULTISPECIES: NADPH-dependent FMN reductase [Pseudooceanicola]MBT9385876.1 NAD(P)H-dependent oxidoreductase [Pseudooceanicola endophyticus]MXN20107.1 NADPH-dependent FMN reductase [Pseudooceanicola albus]
MTKKIVAISGSLRKDAVCTQIANTLEELAPAGTTVEVVTLNDIPMLNEDLKANGSPAPVAALTQQLVDADALVLITPEYNRSTSGALKNVIDWLSKEDAAPLAGMPVEIISHSPGATGGLMANHSLRSILAVPGAKVMAGFEVAISGSFGKVEGGKLTDEGTRDFVAGKLQGLLATLEAKAAA